MSENSCSLDFYNMLVHIVFKNRVSEENVAVKNAWEKTVRCFSTCIFPREKGQTVRRCAGARFI